MPNTTDSRIYSRAELSGVLGDRTLLRRTNYAFALPDGHFDVITFKDGDQRRVVAAVDDAGKLTPDELRQIQKVIGASVPAAPAPTTSTTTPATLSSK
ncbi:MAG: hypothetical protein QM796_18785 [Chthoniobacteraceae bacterium]